MRSWQLPLFDEDAPLWCPHAMRWFSQKDVRMLWFNLRDREETNQRSRQMDRWADRREEDLPTSLPVLPTWSLFPFALPHFGRKIYLFLWDGPRLLFTSGPCDMKPP